MRGLFWFSESCLTYIIFKLHSCINLRRRAKKQRKKMLLPWSLTFQTQPPQLPLHLSLSNSLPVSVRPSVPLSPTPPSHITPLITPQQEANLRECEKCVRVTVSVWVPVLWLWLELLHISVSLTSRCPSTPGWTNQRNCALTSENFMIHWETWGMDSFKDIIVNWWVYAFIW